MAKEIRIVRFSVFGILGISFRIFLQNVFPFLLLSLLVHLPGLLMDLGFPRKVSIELSNEYSWRLPIGLFVNFPLLLLMVIPVMRCTVQALCERPKGLRAHLSSEGFAGFLPSLGTYCLGYFMLLAGTILLVIPGIVVAVLFFVAVPAAIIERRGVFYSFRRSVELTRGHRKRILVILALMFICSRADDLFGFVVSAPLGHFWDWFGVSFEMALFTVVVAVTYQALVVEKSRAIADHMASVQPRPEEMTPSPRQV